MKLSVALATYNGASFLPEQLESYLQQTRRPDELIISDDASVDDTFAICTRFARDAPFPVTLSRNETNVGVVANFEKAIQACTGDVIATSDQDDVWHPDKLAVLATTLDAHPHAGLAFSDADVVDEHLQPTGTRLWKEAGFDRQRQEAVRQGHGFEELFLGSNFVTGAAMAFRSGLRQWCLPVATDVRDLIHDGWIALVAAAVTDIVPISDPLISYRLHDAQTIGLGAPPNLERPRLPLLLFEPVDFDSELRDLTTIRDALRSLPLPPRAEPRLRRLEHMIGHWARRSNLPAGVARRAGVVAKELANRRYFAYSRGLRSAGKDLFFAPGAPTMTAGSDGAERVGRERR